MRKYLKLLATKISFRSIQGSEQLRGSTSLADGGAISWKYVWAFAEMQNFDSKTLGLSSQLRLENQCRTQRRLDEAEVIFLLILALPQLISMMSSRFTINQRRAIMEVPTIVVRHRLPPEPSASSEPPLRLHLRQLRHRQHHLHHLITPQHQHLQNKQIVPAYFSLSDF